MISMKFLCAFIVLLFSGTFVECIVCLRVEIFNAVTLDCLLVRCSAAVERDAKVPVVGITYQKKALFTLYVLPPCTRF